MPHPRVKESERSEELRAELRDQGYTIFWTIQEELTRISYWNNGAGKNILVMEHAIDMKWQAWDIYLQGCSNQSKAATWQALKEWTTGIPA